MARPKLEEVSIVEDDLDDYDPEDLAQLRAYKMMPRWGQVLSWLLWEMPWPWYVIVAGGSLWIFYENTLTWKVVALVTALLFVIGGHARKRTRSPFRYFVIVTRKPVPGGLADAASRGPVREPS